MKNVDKVIPTTYGSVFEKNGKIYMKFSAGEIFCKKAKVEKNGYTIFINKYHQISEVRPATPIFGKYYHKHAPTYLPQLIEELSEENN